MVCVFVFTCVRIVRSAYYCLLFQPGCTPPRRSSRDVLLSNTALSRLLQQRLQQLQRCDAGEGSVEIKRHVTKALAAIRSVASSDSHAAPADDESFMRQDAKSASSAPLHVVDAAAAAQPTSSLMSLKAQRVTSGTLPPPPSLSLPWTTSSHQAPSLAPPAAPAHSEVSGGPSYRHGSMNSNSDIHLNASGSSTSIEAAEAPPPEYSAQRYSPRAEDVKERVDSESEGQSSRQDRGNTRWHSACCMRSIALSPIISRACCSLAKARRLRRRQVAFTQQRQYRPSFVRSLTFAVQLLKLARAPSDVRPAAVQGSCDAKTNARSGCRSFRYRFVLLFTQQHCAAARVLCVSCLGARVFFHLFSLQRFVS